ncbi:MAG: histidine phosphatase family protein [Proteobacteria bacterium]|nr:histidine phosphatase family protein [Pseudomonadota bacterium]
MKNFYIFRHGETDYNLKKIAQGQSVDEELNETGLAQAKNLAEKLKDKKIEIIYSSPLKRALQTAEIVGSQNNINVVIDDNLKERNFGVIEGKSYDYVQKILMDKNDPSFKFEGEESRQEMQNRFLDVLHKLIDTEYKNIGISSHGSAIKSLLLYFDDSDDIMLTKQNGEVVHIQYENGKFEYIR